MENKLKSLSAQELQEIIAKAVSGAINENLEGSIKNISYDDTWTKATFQIELWHPIGDMFKNQK